MFSDIDFQIDTIIPLVWKHLYSKKILRAFIINYSVLTL